MKILVLNCGSSSLKYQLIDMETENVLAKGLCERIGIEGSRLKHQPAGKEAVIFDDYQENHSVSVKMVLDALTNPEYGVVKSMKEINAVGHRVVHGGEYFANSVIITPEVIEAIEKCCDLAPLHNPDRYPCLRRNHARRTSGSSIRYSFPSDNARKSLYVRSALRIL